MASKNMFGTRGVKLDYSETYRDNDNLDDTLNSQIDSIQKLHIRLNKEKDSEIDNIRRDAEHIQNLRTAVNQRDTSKEISEIFDKSRTADYANSGDNSEASRVYRRLQKERDKYSAKNHFNVLLPRWDPQSDIRDRKTLITSLPVSKPTLVAAPIHKTKGRVRSKTYMQLTSASRQRLARPRSVPVPAAMTSRPYMVDTDRCQSATRSRRELETLSRIELSLSEPKILTYSEKRENILSELKSHQKDLQVKVSMFVSDLKRFSGRRRRNKQMLLQTRFGRFDV